METPNDLFGEIKHVASKLPNMDEEHLLNVLIFMLICRLDNINSEIETIRKSIASIESKTKATK